jgi:hypothetical protein
VSQQVNEAGTVGAACSLKIFFCESSTEGRFCFRAENGNKVFRDYSHPMDGDRMRFSAVDPGVVRFIKTAIPSRIHLADDL